MLSNCVKPPLTSTDSLEDKALALDKLCGGPVVGDQSTELAVVSILEQCKRRDACSWEGGFFGTENQREATRQEGS